MRFLGVTLESGRLTILTLGHLAVGQSDIPEQSACIREAGMGFPPGLKALEYSSGHGSHIRFRPFVEQCLQTFAELLLVTLRQIREGVDEYKLGEDCRQWIVGFHLLRQTVHLLVVIGKISRIGLLVHLFLACVHLAQMGEVVGVEHGLPVGGVGEIGEYQPAPLLRLADIVASDGHQIHIVIDVEAIDVVGVSLLKAHELS